MRRLIINADDFGLTAGVNRAIIEAHRRGVVSSATLMAGGGAFAEAAQFAQGLPKLSVGCHVVLVDGTPLLPADQVSTLLGGGNGNAEFRRGLGEFASAALRRRIDPAQVEAEATAQMRQLQAAGITLSHFDTHKHAHMFAAILRPLLRAARACGVPAVRNPFAPVKPLAFAHLLRRPRLWKRRLQGLADWYGLEVTVCHYPRGASKWNPVEHRLFSQISRNWAGVPLRTPALMLALLCGTRTASGLKVTAEWSETKYRRGIVVSDAEMAELNIEHHSTCPQWNYALKPRDTQWWNWN